jgi:hypothetical protein
MVGRSESRRCMLLASDCCVPLHVVAYMCVDPYGSKDDLERDLHLEKLHPGHANASFL